MKLTDNWFTTLSQNDQEQIIIVSGREDLQEFKNSGKFKERVEIYWKYEPDSKGMPDNKVATLMEDVQNALVSMMEKDKLAILTGVYTGAGERTFVFYTRNIPAFGKSLNDALDSFELLPITIYTELDPQWEEYTDMLEMKEFEVK